MSIKGNTFFKVRARVGANNKVILESCVLEKVFISVTGNDNNIIIENTSISDSSIVVSGSKNRIIIDKNVKLGGAIMNVRGENCKISIGEGTSSGGVRMVNVGNDNTISLGKNCLLADHIEIWASDTHSIYNQNNEMINQEKPITIGDRVWIGSNVTILKGISIGSDSVIGMGTMVTKNISSNTVNVGVPNKIINDNITWKIDY